MIKIAIATPAVWAGPDMINNYISRITGIIDHINRLSKESTASFHLEGALLEIQNASVTDLIKHPPTVLIRQLRNSAAVRKNNGMANWWFSNVKSAFEILKVDGVVYLPIDINWEDIVHNTVSNPSRLYGMIEMLISSDNNLVIGNYECSNIDKEYIEKTIYNSLIEKYPAHDKAVTRVRSEFWAITAGSFRKLIAAVDYRGIADPTLLILVEILRKKIDIDVRPYDLGKYEVFDEYDDAKKQLQIDRAKKIILKS